MDEIHSYYDGIPQWIRNLSEEELDRRIKEEEKRLAELNAKLKQKRKPKHKKIAK